MPIAVEIPSPCRTTCWNDGNATQLALRNPLDEESVLAKAAPKPVKKKTYKPTDSGWGSVTVIRGTTVDKSKVRL